MNVSAKLHRYFLYYLIPCHVNVYLCPAHAAHVILQGRHEQCLPELAWQGMGKYKKYLSHIAETFTDVATKKIFNIDYINSFKKP